MKEQYENGSDTRKEKVYIWHTVMDERVKGERQNILWENKNETERLKKTLSQSLLITGMLKQLGITIDKLIEGINKEEITFNG